MTGTELREARKAMGMKLDDVTFRLSKRLRKPVATRTYQGWEARAERPVPIEISEAMTQEIAQYHQAAPALRAVVEDIA